VCFFGAKLILEKLLRRHRGSDGRLGAGHKFRIAKSLIGASGCSASAGTYDKSGICLWCAHKIAAMSCCGAEASDPPSSAPDPSALCGARPESGPERSQRVRVNPTYGAGFRTRGLAPGILDSSQKGVQNIICVEPQE
jgi:hypothetical protein